jgi:hypothetical protein
MNFAIGGNHGKREAADIASRSVLTRRNSASAKRACAFTARQFNVRFYGSSFWGHTMDGSARTQIIVAVIGVVGVIGAALVANWAGVFGGGSKPEDHPIEYSTTCKFTVGPRTGQTQYYPPGMPGLTPAVVGGPCTDGVGSMGYAIANR